jgi:AraC-like DNA-binding protein
VLRREAGEKRFQLSLHPPAEDLTFFVQHHWIVDWDVPDDQPYLQENLPHPSVHMVVEKDRSRIVGVMTGRFSILLQGKGRVVGVRFKPGAFHAFVSASVSTFSNRSLSLVEAFGPRSNQLEAAILPLDDKAAMIEIVERFLRERLPERDPKVELINEIVECIIADRGITRVDHIVSRFGLRTRALQRLFNEYVGATAKWVIKRYRLLEATEHLAAHGEVDWAKLAVDLGYFDQSHFIKDFRSIIGQTPSEYMDSVKATASVHATTPWSRSSRGSTL